MAEPDNEGETVKGNTKKDFSWSYTIINPSEKYFKCQFCEQRCSGTIYHFKHHLAQTHKGMKPCPLAPPEVVEKCKKALDQAEEIKNKRNTVLNDIREVTAGNSQTEVGVGLSQQIVRGLMDNFASSKARQHTLNATWKKDERKEVCRKIGHFFYSAGLAFNSCNDPYFVQMCEAIANFDQGFQPPTMHELRTWFLKVEVDDINKMTEEHKMA